MTQPQTIHEYYNLVDKIYQLDEEEKIRVIRYLCRTDLYFLIWFAFGRRDIEHPWLLDRCKEVQENPNGYLDLWARGHYKSTIITYAKTIQDILASHGENPLPAWKGVEPTFGIFSHTRPIAKGFLRQIKREFESNGLLRRIFKDIIWENCHKEAPKWSEDDGLVLKRKSNPKESTIEAWGLVEGQPTSKHFTVRIYDDVVTQASVTTPEMMYKVLESWELSLNLGTPNGFVRYIGTRYHFNDTYREIIKRNAAIPRTYAATKDGLIEGEPILISREDMAKKRREMGAYTFSTQMLQNPIADETQGFKKDWICWYKSSDGSNMNKYLLVDPASKKKKDSDYTAMMVIGLSEDDNYYVLDMVRDRVNLVERGNIVFRLHRKWKPLSVGYEEYGMQADLEYLKDRQNRENYHFNIVPLGGNIAKIDRIKKLIPSFFNKRWYFPDSIFRTNYQGKLDDLVDIYINEEYLAFPVPVHDDMLDCQARILDPDLHVIWPRTVDDDEPRDRYARRQGKRSSSPWAA